MAPTISSRYLVEESTTVDQWREKYKRRRREKVCRGKMWTVAAWAAGADESDDSSEMWRSDPEMKSSRRAGAKVVVCCIWGREGAAARQR
ncbi:hypothetical protein BHE74_00046940 [Ensete ventricosum]|nr:hypothetical protein GW17_00055026 [Ensete ventricosum]RWW47100.1 hypothetical protein BHE74_00046940 [Ensete ventricosum]